MATSSDLTEPNQVLFLVGDALVEESVSLPRGAVPLWCSTADELRQVARVTQPACVVLAAAVVPNLSTVVATLRGILVGDPLLIVIGGHHGADYRSVDEGDFAALARLIKAALGEPALAQPALPSRPPARAAAPITWRVGGNLIGNSVALRRAASIIERVAPTDATVLLLGETGTGKELAARALHEGSARAERPFVAVNCAALPENLVESTLFGHEAGAFTGAIKRSIGRIEQADGGTLFLDEVGDLPPPAQAKLLRALQERAIDRVGGRDPVRVDVRLVAATNHDLNASIANSSFRQDLFFRLNVVSITLPPLRDRGDDMLLLATYFLARAQKKMAKRGIILGEHAARAVISYAWPGNVRELENVCTRVVALSPNETVLGPEHLNLLSHEELADSPLPSTDLRAILDFCEREIVRRILERNGGNRTRTAEILGISRQALQQKLARYRGVGRDNDEAPAPPPGAPPEPEEPVLLPAARVNGAAGRTGT